jgi:hypothetical protein
MDIRSVASSKKGRDDLIVIRGKSRCQHGKRVRQIVLSDRARGGRRAALRIALSTLQRTAFAHREQPPQVIVRERPLPRVSASK